MSDVLYLFIRKKVEPHGKPFELDDELLLPRGAQLKGVRVERGSQSTTVYLSER